MLDKLNKINIKDSNFITYIIPVYNRENIINEAIDSILNSNIENYEIIIIDDNSTDGTLNVIKEYSSKYSFITVIHLNKNMGPGYARNVGLKNASGKWIYFLDSDDLICTENLKLIIEDINNLCDDIDLVVCNTNTSSTWNEPYFPNNMVLSCDDFLKAYTGILRFPLWSFIFKRDLIENYNLSLPNDMSFFEDLTFLLYFFEYVNKIFVEELIICHYRKGICDNSITSNFNDIKTMYLIEKHTYELCKKIEDLKGNNNVIKRKAYLNSLCRWSLESLLFSENDDIKSNIDITLDLNNPKIQLEKYGFVLFLSKLLLDILHEHDNGNKYFLTPAGRYSKILAELMLNCGIDVLGFIDSYVFDQYTCVNNQDIPIYSTFDAKNICGDTPIIVLNPSEVGTQLEYFLKRQGLNANHWVLKEALL